MSTLLPEALKFPNDPFAALIGLYLTVRTLCQALYRSQLSQLEALSPQSSTGAAHALARLTNPFTCAAGIGVSLAGAKKLQLSCKRSKPAVGGTVPGSVAIRAISSILCALMTVPPTDNVRTPTRGFARVQHIPVVLALRLRLAVDTCAPCGPCI
jgi:hypothetical protein